MSTGSPADNKKRRTETVVDSPAESAESEASVTVCQTREPREPELPQPEDDWTDAQPREVEMTEPELQQRGNDNGEQSDLSELNQELECEPCPVCLAESVLTDVRTGDRLGMSGVVTFFVDWT